MSENINAMKADFSGLLASLGTNAVFKRWSGSLNTTGRSSGAYTAFASGTVLIQPRGGLSYRTAKGLLEQTTHLMFAKTTITIHAENRVLQSGESYEFDVLAVDTHPTHKEVQLKRVLRT